MAQPTDAELLANVGEMQERIEEQEKETEAQKAVAAMQQKDTTKLHVHG